LKGDAKEAELLKSGGELRRRRGRVGVKELTTSDPLLCEISIFNDNDELISRLRVGLVNCLETQQQEIVVS